MSKHTPGPWLVEQGERTDADNIDVISPDGRDDPWTVAVAIGSCGPGGCTIANARLIAAAPDLLEALTSIADQLERVGDSRKDAPFIEAARAAIAKAEGRA